MGTKRLQFKMDPVKKYRLFLIACCANLGVFSNGVYIGWTSPIIPKLRDNTDDSPLDFGINKVQEGWIGSLTAVGAFFGALVVGKLTSKLGRKLILLSTSFYFVTSYILLIVGRSVWIIYVARLLQGFGGGIGCAVSPMYMGEIATDNLRGALGSLVLLFMSSGIVFAYCVGPYVSFMTFQWICLSIPVLYFIAFSFMPETPYFYAMKNRTADGIKALSFLRGQKEKTVENVMEYIQKEVDESMVNKGSVADIFRNRVYRKAFLIGCGLLVFQQLSGTKAVSLNTQSIFSSANSSIDPAVGTILVGIAQLVSNFLTPYMTECVGRKITLMISSCGMCLALLALGTFFYIQKFGDVSNILWLPVPALMIFNLLFGFGLGPISWAVLGEMFPSNIKSSATSIACLITWVVSFCVVRWFPELNALGAYYVFWFFGIMCGLAFFFVLFVVIETRGISLQTIQKNLEV